MEDNSDVSVILEDGIPPTDYRYIRIKNFRHISEADSNALVVSFKNLVTKDKLTNLNIHLLDTLGTYYTGATGKWLKTWCELSIKYPNGTVEIIHDFEVAEQTADDPGADAFAVVLDHSRSMGNHRAFILQDGAEEFIRKKKPADAIAVLKYDCYVNVESRLSTDLNTLLGELKKNGLEEYGGSTSILDGILKGVALLEKLNDFGKRTVILFTDGEENCSRTKKNRPLRKAKKNDIAVSVISFGNYVNNPYLKSIAYNTGGSHYEIFNTDHLSWILTDVVNKEKNFYTIKFKTDSIGKHTLMLKVCNDQGIQDTLLIGFETTFIPIDEVDENGEDAFGIPFIELRTTELNVSNFFGSLRMDTLEQLISSSGSDLPLLKPNTANINQQMQYENTLTPELLKNYKNTGYSPEIIGEFGGLKFPNIKFIFDKTVIVEGTDEGLDELINFLKKFRQVNIKIVGHTDNYGSFEYNQKLSERRAKKVAGLLIAAGIETDRIHTSGESENVPLSDNNSPEHRILNRRVEFRLAR
jgi:outer membrane protein OmpA-like peptidoglycan-associated protein